MPSLKPKSIQKNQYLKFSGIAFQMMVFILLGLAGGYKLDQYLNNTIPFALISGTLLGFALALFALFRGLSS